MAAKDDLGRRGEAIAEQRLRAAGMRVIDRNWRCPLGELDLVAVDGAQLVFVEVKTRSSVAFGHPVEAVTPVKLARLRRLAGAWCDAHPDVRGRLRIDVIAIVAPPDAEPDVQHLRGVF